jgi:glycerophosphoryl diester phosphodiesterase
MTLSLGIQGHRGARALFPENTLEGFCATASLGVTAFELDVGMTADGVVIVHHDPALNPDTARDDRGNWVEPGRLIHRMTFADLQRCDVGRLRPGSRTAALFPDQKPSDGARIPTLEAVLRALPGASFTVEIKTHPPRPDDTAPPDVLTDAALKIIDIVGAGGRVVIESFDWRVPRHVRRTRPDLRQAWLTAPSMTNAGWWDVEPLTSVPASVAREGGPIWAPLHTSLTEHDVRMAHALGLLVLPWTVNAPDEMQRLIAWGVDGLISDRPDLALALVA